MRTVDWKDWRGRIYRVELPDGVPEEDAAEGIPIGPPDVVDLLEDVPEAFKTRLHNELHRRGLWTLAHAQKRPQEVQAALTAALRVDVTTIVNAYVALAREEAALDGTE